ncbi:MAG: methionyl-tRNA formyltransferase [bacterium]|nr:methionyl-tRNA formyltransferase [bacterium]
MNIVFFGTSEFAVPALEALIKAGYVQITVVTTPDKPAGRGLEIGSSPIKQCVKDRWLLLMQPEKLDEAFLQKIRDLKPDVGVVAAYGKILSKELIEIFPKGILNIHPSLLPKYRGASPIEFSILAGEENNTGVSIILIDEKMDHGPILSQTRFRSVNNLTLVWNYSQLHDSLAKLSAELLIETLPEWLAGKIIPIPQDESEVTVTKIIKKEDGKIDWNQSAGYIERMTRAYEKWPGAYTLMENKILKIIKAEVVERNLTIQPGTVFEKEGFPAVACGELAVKLLIVKPEGKNEMPGDAYLRGHREILKSIL